MALINSTKNLSVSKRWVQMVLGQFLYTTGLATLGDPQSEGKL